VILNTCKIRVYRAHRLDAGVIDTVTGNRTVSATKLLQDLNDEQALLFVLSIHNSHAMCFALHSHRNLRHGKFDAQVTVYRDKYL